MGLEIERKFLVGSVPEAITHQKKIEIIQGYLAIDDDGNEVRIRKAGETYSMTVKSDGSLERKEFETEISESQFRTLYPASDGRRIEKTRYYIEYMGKTIELDVYHGSLSGLIVAEIEFSSTEQSNQFSPAEWFGMEITEDKRYKNKSLAVKGLPK